MMHQGDQLERMERLFERLWGHYVAITPDAVAVHDLLREQGEAFSNDHVALRTFDLARVGIPRLAAPFVACGYLASGDYRFEHKKLRARSFRHPSGKLPRVFISALDLNPFPGRLRQLVEHLVAQVPDTEGEALLTTGSAWAPIVLDDYRFLQEQSEYAAWVAAFGFRVNHFTVHVNDLQRFADLGALNDFLQRSGFELNGERCKIQGSPAALLEQSSTVARQIPWRFADAHEARIPGGYYEFAKRYPDPATGELFDGFVAASADKIFESTDARPQGDAP